MPPGVTFPAYYAGQKWANLGHVYINLIELLEYRKDQAALSMVLREQILKLTAGILAPLKVTAMWNTDDIPAWQQCYVFELVWKNVYRNVELGLPAFDQVLDFQTGRAEDLKQFQDCLANGSPVIVLGSAITTSLASNASVEGTLLNKACDLMFETQGNLTVFPHISAEMQRLRDEERRVEDIQTSTVLETRNKVGAQCDMFGLSAERKIRPKLGIFLAEVQRFSDGCSDSDITKDVCGIRDLLGEVAALSEAIRESSAVRRAQMAELCMLVYEVSSGLGDLGSDVVGFERCIQLSQCALELARPGIDPVMAPESLVEPLLVAFRLLAIAAVLALDNGGRECGPNDRQLEILLKKLSDISEMPPGETGSFHAVTTDARMLHDALATPETRRGLPGTWYLMRTEVVWARGMMLESGTRRAPLAQGDRGYVGSVVRELELDPPVTYETVSVRSGLRALAQVPNASLCTITQDSILEEVLDRRSISIQEVCTDSSAMSAHQREVLHLHGVASVDSSVHYAVTYQDFCRGHVEFLAALLGPSMDPLCGKSAVGLLSPSGEAKPASIRPMVFVGTGHLPLEDPHFLSLFERLNILADKKADYQRHYVLGAQCTTWETVQRLNTRFPFINLVFIDSGSAVHARGPFLVQHKRFMTVSHTLDPVSLSQSLTCFAGV
ncbi:hypothetical protein KIPB_002312 [Kipferlia bialata]|uniref:Uncharacterized protein n=1 Tax=Kipferlia bialata TaxID=797122 RepID=A0A9K3CTL5_9EUKA|nr:hypothetical protein KIPB_002312 [Kipferlia bialata]|eukprot:g2312.t1